MKYSNVIIGHYVPIPAFRGERIYMLPFDEGVLPPEYARWQPTVDAMMNGRTTKAYLMVDQKVVHKGQVHRRPGLHVDGVWDGHDHRHRISTSDWKIDWKRSGSQTIILAANTIGCVAYCGWYDGEPARGGDCSHIDVGSLGKVVMTPNTAHYGDALTMLHESIPQLHTGPRTVVRINVENI